MKRRLFGWFIAAAITAAPWCSSTYAAVMPLSDLIAGGTITSGDKVFSDFTYVASGDMPSAAGINVLTIQGAEGDYGMRFQGPFQDRAGGDPSDALITFNVSVAPGSSMEINGATMIANPAVFAGPGFGNVVETFAPAVENQSLIVYDFGDGDIDLVDSELFAQTFKTLPVQKDIILHATGAAGAVTMSFIDQTFSQVPEPSSLLLVLSGLIGLAGLRRRTG
jgi:hypothetical protein